MEPARHCAPRRVTVRRELTRKEIYDPIDNSCGQIQPAQFLYEYSIFYIFLLGYIFSDEEL